MGPTSTGNAWPSLGIGVAGLIVACVVAAVIARRVSTLREQLAPGSGPHRPDNLRASSLRRGRGAGAAVSALAVGLVGLALAVVVTSVLGKITKLSGVVHADRPVYHYFLQHRAGWLTAVLSRLTHVGEYPEMTAIALAAALVLGLRLRRYRVLAVVVLAAVFIAVLVQFGKLYNWVDMGAFVAFAAAAVLLRQAAWLSSAVLMATVQIEKYLQQLVTDVVHGTVPSAHTSVGGVGPFPSGGCTRTVVIVGVAGYLLARSYASLQASVWLVVGCAAVASVEGYSRIYLGKHWAVDCLGGLFFGAVLALALVAALRTWLGPLPQPDAAPARVAQPLAGG
ncbi:MAG: phosphatase PAP2 family protein [Jatrophihabitantaceae bacterium]